MGYIIQDTILNRLRESKVSVTLFTVNGFQMQGKITDHDESVIVLNDGKQKIVYKHAVSTIVPDNPVDL